MRMQTIPGEFEQYVQPPARPLWGYFWPWLLIIPMLLFAAGNMFSFQAGPSSEAVGNGLQTTGGAAKGQNELLAVSYSILIILILSRYRRVLRMTLEMKALTCLACFALLSVFWSQWAQNTAIRAIYFMVDTMFAYWLVTKLSSAQIRSFFLMVGSVIAACSLFTVLVLPRYGVQGSLVHFGMWRGIFVEKNHAGGVYLFLLTPVVDYSRRLGWKRAVYAAAILLLLVMSQSGTACVGALLYPLMMLYLHLIKRVEPRLALMVSATASAVLVVCVALIVPNLPEILVFFGKDPTLTGRTVVWAHLMHSVAKRPLLGYGYYAFWTGLLGESGLTILALKWGFSYAHNGYLEVVLGSGLVGLSLILFVLMRGLSDAWACFGKAANPETAWYTGIILLTIVYNFDEETFFFCHHLGSFLLLVSLCGLRLARRQLGSRTPLRAKQASELGAQEAAYSR